MCESSDRLVTNRFTTDCRFVPAEPLVEFLVLGLLFETRLPRCVFGQCLGVAGDSWGCSGE
jgi:hypothetical protein